MKQILSLVLVALWAVPASAQSSGTTIDDVRYQADPLHQFGSWGDITTRSNNNRTLTTMLPPDAALTDDLGAVVDVTYDPRVASWYPPVSYNPMNYGDGLIQMSYQSNTVTNGVRTITLEADRDKLKDLDEVRTYRLGFQPGSGNELRWEIHPYRGPNYVSKIGVNPGSPLPGDLVEFEITLSEPVSSADGEQIAWRLVPGDAFEYVKGGVKYDANDLNSATVPQGEQVIRLTVRVSRKASAGSTARIETWPAAEVNTMEPPAYQSRTFRIGTPRRR